MVSEAQKKATSKYISKAYDHLNPGKPKCTDEKPKNIVIPKEHKK